MNGYRMNGRYGGHKRETLGQAEQTPNWGITNPYGLRWCLAKIYKSCNLRGNCKLQLKEKVGRSLTPVRVILHNLTSNVPIHKINFSPIEFARVCDKNRQIYCIQEVQISQKRSCAPLARYRRLCSSTLTQCRIAAAGKSCPEEKETSAENSQFGELEDNEIKSCILSHRWLADNWYTM